MASHSMNSKFDKKKEDVLPSSHRVSLLLLLHVVASIGVKKEFQEERKNDCVTTKSSFHGAAVSLSLFLSLSLSLALTLFLNHCFSSSFVAHNTIRVPRSVAPIIKESTCCRCQRDAPRSFPDLRPPPNKFSHWSQPR